MEADRRSKRKPLSDCTNILPTSRKKPPSSLPTKIPNSKTLIKPSKSSKTSATTLNKVASLPTNSSQKSHTSIGSNNSSDSVTVPSVPQSSAPPTPLSKAGGIDSDKSELSVDQSRRHDAMVQSQRHGATVQSERHGATVQSQRHGATVQSQRHDATDPSHDATDQSQRHYAMTRKDKGKMIAEMPTILLSAPAQSASEPHQAASSSSPYLRHDTPKKKDKGKLFADIPIIPFLAQMASKPLRIASSSPPRRTSSYEIQGVQGQNLSAQTSDKGKTTVDASLMLKQLETPLSGTSDCSLSEQAAYSPKLHKETRKEDKLDLESPNVEEFEPSTPHSFLASPAASGTSDRPLTVYNQRRSQRVRKNAVGKIKFSSSHSEQRIRKTGTEFHDYQSSKKGSHTDPLPAHQKKRFHGKHDGPKQAMPQEEIEKLRAYYADIDAFELPEEVASEDDLE